MAKEKHYLTENAELMAEWDWEKNEKTPDQYTIGSAQKVWWKCPKGHSYDLRISSRTGPQKCGCPYCSVPPKRLLKGFNDFQTKFPELAKEWHPTKNGSLTPSDVFPGSGKTIWWQCEKGHEWESTVNKRTSRGNGCPQCSAERKTSFPEQTVFYYLNKVFNDTENRFDFDYYEIDIYIPSKKTGIEYDGQFYHTSTASIKREERKNAYLQKRIRLIRIKESKENRIENDIIYYKQNQSYAHLRWAIISIFDLIGYKGEIPDIDISRDRIKILQQYIKSEKENSLANKYPEIAQQWNYSKNGLLDPTMVSYSSNKKVWWICSQGHEYESSINHRASGRGCPYCTGKKILKGFNDLQTKNPELAKEWHPIKNGNLTPSEIMPNSMQKVWWQCSKGHEWEETVNNRNRGRNCPYCSGHRVLKGFNDLQTKYPKIAEEWHPTKNGNRHPSDYTTGSTEKVWWRCSKGHEFESKIQKRINGNGCPYCSGLRHSSIICVETQKVYQSFADAAADCGLTVGDSISMCCKGKLKTAGGYHWEFVKEGSRK